MATETYSEQVLCPACDLDITVQIDGADGRATHPAPQCNWWRSPPSPTKDGIALGIVRLAKEKHRTRSMVS